jgi:hypothetical protein
MDEHRRLNTPDRPDLESCFECVAAAVSGGKIRPIDALAVAGADMVPMRSLDLHLFVPAQAGEPDLLRCFLVERVQI